MTETPDGTDPGAAFAAMMGQAAELADTEAAEAPFGYRKDGQPKKAPGGRPRRSPSIEDLKGEPAAEPGEESTPSSDRAPEPPADRAPDDAKRRRARTRAPAAREAVPSYKAGVITIGVNRLYRRAGKIVRAMDADIGEAIIQSARNTADPGEPDDSVGAAWEELAKTNPRIRKFLMKCIAGGAWGQLVMAHAPIAMAILMKPAILRIILFSRFIESMAEPDEDTPEGDGGLPGGMTAADAGDMARLAQQQIAAMGLSVPPEVAEQMAAAAQSMMNGGKVPVPAGTVRQQPRRPPSRAKRHS